MKRLLSILPWVALIALPVGIVAQRLLGSALPPVVIDVSTASPLEGLRVPAAPRTGSLTGRVVSVDGDAIPHALVMEVSEIEPRWTNTDEDGRFALECAEPRPWTLTVVAREFSPIDFAVPADHEEAEELEILLGSRLPAPPKLEPIERRALEGRIVRASGPADDLAGYEVLVQPRRPLDTLGGPVPRRTSTDARGRFVMPELAAGEYRLTVLPPWAKSGSWPNLCTADDRPLLHKGTGPSEPRAIELSVGEIRGRVSDTGGTFLTGAMVWVASSENVNHIWPPLVSDEDGTFLVRDLPPGSYEVTVQAGEGSDRTPVVVHAGTTGTIGFELAVSDER